MIRRPVTSSHLSSVGWEEDEGNEGSADGTLEVEFRGGKVYRYFEVPRVIYEQLVGASSPGMYFNRNISGIYDEEKVS